MANTFSGSRLLAKAILPFLGREFASAVFVVSPRDSTQIASNAAAVITNDIFRRLALPNPTPYNAPAPFASQTKASPAPPERHPTHADCGLAILLGGTSAVERVTSYLSLPTTFIGAPSSPHPPGKSMYSRFSMAFSHAHTPGHVAKRRTSC